jgi:hypothetical protein
MRVCGSGDVRRRRLLYRSGKAVYWRAALPLGHATTFAAARWCRASWPTTWNEFLPISMPIKAIAVLVSETRRAPCLWRPLPASLVGGPRARPDHGHQLPRNISVERAPDAFRRGFDQPVAQRIDRSVIATASVAKRPRFPEEVRAEDEERSEQ